jgi:hypothetical protein
MIKIWIKFEYLEVTHLVVGVDLERETGPVFSDTLSHLELQILRFQLDDPNQPLL